MNFEEIKDAATALAQEAIEDASPTTAEACGMDERAGGRVFIGDDFIAVRLSDDRLLQYYAGFEYVDKDYRTEVGGYVFYATESERVAQYHDRISGVEE